MLLYKTAGLFNSILQAILIIVLSVLLFIEIVLRCLILIKFIVHLLYASKLEC